MCSLQETHLRDDGTGAKQLPEQTEEMTVPHYVNDDRTITYYQMQAKRAANKSFASSIQQEDKSKQDEEEEQGFTKVTRKKQRKKTNEELRSLVTIMPEGVNSVGEANEWEEIDMAVDSAATETVVNEDMLTSIETTVGEAAKKWQAGVSYLTWVRKSLWQSIPTGWLDTW